MATVTYRPGPHDPASVTWGGIEFPANIAVPVADARLLAKAGTNRFFEVSDAPVVDVEKPKRGRPRKVKGEEAGEPEADDEHDEDPS